MTVETRTVNAAAEIRQGDAEKRELRFNGHAAVFDQRTWIGPKQWGFWEKIDRGFFRDVLNDDAAFLVNHDPNIVLARNPTTMKLSIDERGLVADAEWDPADPDAVKWAGRVKRGDVGQMSFAFTVREEKWEVDEETGEETRTLLTADKLYDASLVTYPAYSGTDGGMRDSAAVAEVVKRHRGFDPRDSQRPTITINNPVATTPAAAVDQAIAATDQALANRDALGTGGPAGTPLVPDAATHSPSDQPVPAEGLPPAEPVNPVEQTEPAPVDSPPAEPILTPAEADPTPAEGADPIVEPVAEPAAEPVSTRELLQLRHRLIAAKYHLSL